VTSLVEGDDLAEGSAEGSTAGGAAIRTPASENVIEVRNLSKRFSVGLRHTMHRGLKDLFDEVTMRRREDDRSLREGEFYALDDVSFCVERGAAFGVMGLNGAGKSTLLRLLAGITKPDGGEVVTRGQVGVLLDPMGGFDGLLSGRESVRASSLLWRYSSAEVDALATEIMDFADIGEFIDAPVRTYSKGMRMRLAFAISVYLDPDVLLIDETLGVGDTRFQQKCEQRLREFTQRGGSLVIVSHSIHAIQGMCSEAIILDHGQVVFSGPSRIAVQHYTELVARAESETYGLDESQLSALERYADELEASTGSEAVDAPPPPDHGPGGPSPDETEAPTPDDEPATLAPRPSDPADPFHGRSVSFTKVAIVGPDGGDPVTGRPATVSASFVSKERIAAADWGIILVTPDGLAPIAADVTEGPDEAISITPGRGHLEAVFPAFPLMPGSYMLRLAMLERETMIAVGLHGLDTPATFFTVQASSAMSPHIERITAPSMVDIGEVEWGGAPD
jgi:ABC-type polysaccharide/polyol phosphate transport system ATPase subunit